MIGYLDTSVLVPLLVAEPSSNACRRFWNDSDEVVSSRLLYIEAAAALAQAQRMGRLTDVDHRTCLRVLERLWAEVEIAEIDQDLVVRAAELARRFALRGYDAMHCAAAVQLDDPNLVAASGDQQLLRAWGELGIATFDSNSQPPPVAEA